MNSSPDPAAPDLRRAEPKDAEPAASPDPSVSGEAESPLDAPPDRRDVQDAFFWILGRPPESEDAVEAHSAIPTRRELRNILLRSSEFGTAYAAAAAAAPGEGSRWIAAEVLNGRMLWLDLNDPFVSRAVLNESLKPAETRLVQGLLKRGDAAVDAGANIGWFAAVAADAVGRLGRVLALEPSDRIRPYLTKTVAANEWSAVISVSPFALWDEAGPRRLVQDETIHNPGHSWIASEAEEGSPRPVECRRLDDLVDLPKLKLLKLSVEGAEFHALRGAEVTLRSQSPVVLAELNTPMLRLVSGVEPADLLELMSAQGYGCRLLAPNGYDGEGEPDSASVTAADLQALGEETIRTLVFSR